MGHWKAWADVSNVTGGLGSKQGGFCFLLDILTMKDVSQPAEFNATDNQCPKSLTKQAHWSY